MPLAVGLPMTTPLVLCERTRALHDGDAVGAARGDDREICHADRRSAPSSTRAAP
jgi:hypothetical protein